MDSRCISKEFVIEFLQLYRSQPCLWKIKCKDYSNREKKQEAYKLLIDKLREIDRNANKEMVVKKIDSFRGSFRKELRKIEELKNSGGGAGAERYKPKLWYFEHLTFLCDQIPGKNVLNLDESSNEMSIKVEEHQYLDENSVDDLVDEPSLISLTPTPSLTGAETSISAIPKSFDNLSSKKRQVDTCDEETVKKVCVHLDKPDSLNDEFSVMAANISNKLRKLPPETVSVVEKLITDVLFEAQCGNISQYSRINLVDSRKNSNYI